MVVGQHISSMQRGYPGYEFMSHEHTMLHSTALHPTARPAQGCQKRSLPVSKHFLPNSNFQTVISYFTCSGI